MRRACHGPPNYVILIQVLLKWIFSTAAIWQDRAVQLSKARFSVSTVSSLARPPSNSSNSEKHSEQASHRDANNGSHRETALGRRRRRVAAARALGRVLAITRVGTGTSTLALILILILVLVLARLSLRGRIWFFGAIRGL